MKIMTQSSLAFQFYSGIQAFTCHPIKMKVFSWAVLLLVGLVVSSLGGNLEETGMTEQEMTEYLIEHRLGLQEWFLSGFYGTRGTNRDIITCALCQTLIATAINWIRQGLPMEQIISNGVGLCNSVDIVDPEICEMIVPIYAYPLHYMISNRSYLNRFDICGVFLGGGPDPCGGMNSTLIDWSTSIDGNKPPLIDVPLVPADVPKVKVLHFTDFHPDLHYVEGSLNDCGKPLCCRPDSRDDPTNSSIAAGPYGDFLCDFPIHSTQKLLQDAAAAHPDAEFILATGDLVHHQVWNTSIEDNLAHYEAYASALDLAFPSMQIYPAIGNHEPHPCNMFPPTSVWTEGYDLSWMYEAQANIYARHLTPASLETFRKGGYYSQLHKEGFRIIAINTNFCYTNNFWLVYETIDFEGQLQWFSNALAAAEAAGEKVWILGHVPPGDDDCWHIWSKQFVQVINRYEAIIQAQFYGHTHNDDIRIFFDKTEEPPRPIGSLFIGASVTPYTDLNPGYKVFYGDGGRDGESTWEILDHETWVYNLTQANEGGLGVAPVWYKEYSAKEAYGLESFRPKDLYEFVVRMAMDDNLFLDFYRHWYKDSGRESEDEDCPSGGGPVTECKFEFLCPIVTTDNTGENCDRLKVEVAKRLGEL